MRGNGVAEFYFRQYLFACQARLLFKLNRPTEVIGLICSLCALWTFIQARHWQDCNRPL